VTNERPSFILASLVCVGSRARWGWQRRIRSAKTSFVLFVSMGHSFFFGTRNLGPVSNARLAGQDRPRTRHKGQLRHHRVPAPRGTESLERGAAPEERSAVRRPRCSTSGVRPPHRALRAGWVDQTPTWGLGRGLLGGPLDAGFKARSRQELVFAGGFRSICRFFERILGRTKAAPCSIPPRLGRAPQRALEGLARLEIFFAHFNASSGRDPKLAWTDDAFFLLVAPGNPQWMTPARVRSFFAIDVDPVVSRRGKRAPNSPPGPQTGGWKEDPRSYTRRGVRRIIQSAQTRRKRRDAEARRERRREGEPRPRRPQRGVGSEKRRSDQAPPSAISDLLPTSRRTSGGVEAQPDATALHNEPSPCRPRVGPRPRCVTERV